MPRYIELKNILFYNTFLLILAIFCTGVELRLGFFTTRHVRVRPTVLRRNEPVSLRMKVLQVLLGHPTIHVGDACRDKQAILSKEGLIKCAVLPPKRLYLPVVRYRCNNKICFAYAGRAQSNAIFSGECLHESTAQRSLTSTWVVDEVRLNIQKG